jgi:hypothetical protein
VKSDGVIIAIVPRIVLKRFIDEINRSNLNDLKIKMISTNLFSLTSPNNSTNPAIIPPNTIIVSKLFYIQKQNKSNS